MREDRFAKACRILIGGAVPVLEVTQHGAGQRFRQ